MKRFRIWFSVCLLAFSALGLAALARPARGAPDEISAWLRKVKVGKPTVYRNLALYPLMGPERHLPSCYPLDRAISEEVLHIRELNEGGSVNLLTVENTGDRAVFIMAGEILSGAKQDRVLQHDLWLPPHSGRVEVGVYCVEHGRWTYRDPKKTFASKSTLSNASVRAAAQLERSQGAVWKSVDDTNRGAGVAAPTQSLNSAYEDKHFSRQVDEYSRRFEGMLDEHPGMCGVLVQVQNRFTTVDLFPDRKILHRLWPKLVRSYALEARGTWGRWEEERSIPIDREQAEIFLEHCQDVQARQISNVGEGQLFTLGSSRLGGEALLLEAGPAHIDLFTRSHVAHPTPRPRPTVRSTPWPPAQDLLRPHRD